MHLLRTPTYCSALHNIAIVFRVDLVNTLESLHTKGSDFLLFVESRLDGLLVVVVDQLLGAEPSATPGTTLGRARTTNRQALLDRGRHAV